MSEFVSPSQLIALDMQTYYRSIVLLFVMQWTLFTELSEHNFVDCSFFVVHSS